MSTPGAPPPIDPQPYASPLPNQDEEHLKLLCIFYYIWAGIDVLAACAGGLYILLAGTMLSAVASGAPSSKGEAPPVAALGALFGVVGFGMIATLGGLALLHFFAAKAITERRNSTLVYVSAAICCLSVPLGTILGVFTFIVMSRPSVKAIFVS